MDTISLKMESQMLHDIDSMLADFRYSTRTEFIRDAIRIKLKELEKEKAIQKLYELKGSFKSRMSEEEAGKIAIKKIADKLGVKLN